MQEIGKTPTILDVGIETLKPHPLNREIYEVNEEEDKKLEESIKAEGIKSPIFITDKDVVLDGHRRLRIAKKLGFEFIPAIIEYPRSKEEEAYLILTHNLYRVKKPREIFKEQQIWEKILKPLAQQRKKKGKKIPDLPLNLEEGIMSSKGEVAEEVAKKTGVSRAQIYKIDYIYTHEEDSRKAEEIVKELDKGKISVHRAYERMKEEIEKELKIKTAKACDWCGRKMTKGEFKYLVAHQSCLEEMREYLWERRRRILSE